MENWIGVAIAFGTGILFILIGMPLLKRKIAPNHFYGYRTRATKSNPAIWYSVNALTGKYLVLTGAVLVVFGLIGLAALNDPAQQEMLVWISIVTMAIGVLAAIVAGMRLSRESVLRPESDQN